MSSIVGQVKAVEPQVEMGGCSRDSKGLQPESLVEQWRLVVCTEDKAWGGLGQTQDCEQADRSSFQTSEGTI